MSSFEENRVPIGKLYKSISNWVSEKECFSFFERIFDEYDKKWKKDLRGNHWKNSLPRKILQVHERIELTAALNSNLSQDSESVKRFMYPSLITYLRLTCFDQLGQPSEWMTFDNWVGSKKKENERNLVISQINTNDKAEFSKQLYLKYQEIYGVKNSFYRFLREIIPQYTREELFKRINITIYNEYAEDITETYNWRKTTDKDKESYLYQIRNDYTHNTFGQGPIFGFIPKNNDRDWRIRELVYVNKESQSISTSVDFEEYLKEVVLIGISEIIKK